MAPRKKKVFSLQGYLFLKEASKPWRLKNESLQESNVLFAQMWELFTCEQHKITLAPPVGVVNLAPSSQLVWWSGLTSW